MGRVAGVMVAGCLALLVGTGAASADDGMRCGSKLVGRGDSPYRVRALCGEPVEAQSRVEFRTIAQQVPHPTIPGRFVQASRTVEVQVEIWLYDFGPHKFVRRVTFEQGQLVRVETEHYGVAR